MLKKFREIIKKICKKNDIKFTLLSKDWVIMLEKNNKTHFITGCKFPLNNHAIGEILDDKYALYEVLRKNNIPVVEYNILYQSSNNNNYALDCNNINIVKEYFYKNNNNIVIKPCNGTCGNNVFHITKIKDIDLVIKKIFKKNETLCYCPYYEIKNEYRVIVLNNEIEIIYKKCKPIVIGNGINTIKELLLQFNYYFFKDKLNDEKYNIILEEEKMYEYDWKFNLSTGAIANFEIDDYIIEELKNITLNIINKLEIKFASIDIVEINNKLYVLEINSGVMMEHLFDMIEDSKIVENIYEKALLTMFNDK